MSVMNSRINSLSEVVGIKVDDLSDQYKFLKCSTKFYFLAARTQNKKTNHQQCIRYAVCTS